MNPSARLVPLLRHACRVTKNERNNQTGVGIFTALANPPWFLYCADCAAWTLARIRFLGRHCGIASAHPTVGDDS